MRPKGNHNALKTGKYSKRFRDAISTLMNTPEFKAILIAYRKKQIKQHKLANHVVEEALRRYLMKANNLANPSTHILSTKITTILTTRTTKSKA